MSQFCLNSDSAINISETSWVGGREREEKKTEESRIWEEERRGKRCTKNKVTLEHSSISRP